MIRFTKEQINKVCDMLKSQPETSYKGIAKFTNDVVSGPRLITEATVGYYAMRLRLKKRINNRKRRIVTCTPKDGTELDALYPGWRPKEEPKAEQTDYISFLKKLVRDLVIVNKFEEAKLIATALIMLEGK